VFLFLLVSAPDLLTGYADAECCNSKAAELKSKGLRAYRLQPFLHYLSQSAESHIPPISLPPPAISGGLCAMIVKLKFQKQIETDVISIDFQTLKKYDGCRLAHTKVAVSLCTNKEHLP
jgi:hypothetical protein